MTGRSAQSPNSSHDSNNGQERRQITGSKSIIITLSLIVILLAILIALVSIYVASIVGQSNPIALVTIANTAVPFSVTGGRGESTFSTPFPSDAMKGGGSLQGDRSRQPTESPLEPKEIIYSYETIATWTPTPRPTNTPTAAPTAMPTFVLSNSARVNQPTLRILPGEKWIDVNLNTQTLVAYEGAAPVFDTKVSTGTARHPTVAGQFRIWLRFRSQTMDGRRLGYDYYLKGVPFVQYFYEDYALHGTYWHNNFGNPMSHGCVNLPTPAAEWLYNWADYGTLVNIHD